jgi:serine protease Do
MEETPVVYEGPSPSRSPSRTKLLIIGLLIIAVLIGIGIGLNLPDRTWAGQENHTIKVNHTGLPPSSAVSAALTLSTAFAEAAQSAEPAVVHIETTAPPTKGNDPLDFFRNNRRFGRGAGSGVLVDPGGYILTNHHVIEGAATIRVRLRDGRTFTPEVIGSDDETDLAVIKIRGENSFPFALVGDSERLKVGDWVLAVGSPFGLEQSVTAGIISALDRDTGLGGSTFQQFLQTDAAINPGNSGGPLVNLKGEIVGINTMISTENGVYSGVGFAIPTSVVVNVYNQLVTKSSVERGWLGVVRKPVPPEVARVYGLPEPYGALIEDVASEDGPAAQAGLRCGDIIIEFDGRRVENERHLTRMVASSEVGRTVRLRYLRDGREMTTTAKLGSRPVAMSARQPAGRDVPEKSPEASPKTPDEPLEATFGAKLGPVSQQTAGVLKLSSTKGALIDDVVDGTLADTLGLQAGQVILRLNRQEIKSPDHLFELLGRLRSGDDLVLEMAGRRPGRTSGRLIVSTVVP